MHDFLLYTLAAAGLSHLVVDSSLAQSWRTWLSELSLSKIYDDLVFLPATLRALSVSGAFAWLRDKAVEMTLCFQCSGFWAGLAVALLDGNGPVRSLLWGFAISLASPLFGFGKMWLALKTSVDEQ